MIKYMAEQLKIKDLHPVLQFFFETGAEVQCALQSSIKDGKLEKTVLNLSETDEENREKIAGYLTPSKAQREIGISYKFPIYAREHSWRVHFAYMKGREFFETCSFVVSGVKSEHEGLAQLRVIASQLQKVYGLSYSPEVLRDRQPLA